MYPTQMDAIILLAYLLLLVLFIVLSPSLVLLDIFERKIIFSKQIINFIRQIIFSKENQTFGSNN